jgi:hypothetical protein
MTRTKHKQNTTSSSSTRMQQCLSLSLSALLDWNCCPASCRHLARTRHARLARATCPRFLRPNLLLLGRR